VDFADETVPTRVDSDRLNDLTETGGIWAKGE